MIYLKEKRTLIGMLFLIIFMPVLIPINVFAQLAGDNEGVLQDEFFQKLDRQIKKFKSEFDKLLAMEPTWRSIKENLDQIKEIREDISQKKEQLAMATGNEREKIAGTIALLNSQKQLLIAQTLEWKQKGLEDLDRSLGSMKESLNNLSSSLEKIANNSDRRVQFALHRTEKLISESLEFQRKKTNTLLKQMENIDQMSRLEKECLLEMLKSAIGTVRVIKEQLRFTRRKMVFNRNKGKVRVIAAKLKIYQDTFSNLKMITEIQKKIVDYMVLNKSNEVKVMRALNELENGPNSITLIEEKSKVLHDMIKKMLTIDSDDDFESIDRRISNTSDLSEEKLDEQIKQHTRTLKSLQNS